MAAGIEPGSVAQPILAYPYEFGKSRMYPFRHSAADRNVDININIFNIWNCMKNEEGWIGPELEVRSVTQAMGSISKTCMFVAHLVCPVLFNDLRNWCERSFNSSKSTFGYLGTESRVEL